MYLKTLIPQDSIPTKFFDVIHELSQKSETVFVNVMQGNDFYPCRHNGETISTNCWIEISTEPLRMEAKPEWRPSSA